MEFIVKYLIVVNYSLMSLLGFSKPTKGSIKKVSKNVYPGDLALPNDYQYKQYTDELIYSKGSIGEFNTSWQAI